MGSSPLTRGKLCPPLWSSSARGLIPAHAGKTGRGGKPYRRQRAHPRSRGENAPLEPTPERRPGSSPLTRGKLSQPARGALSVGLIPAHAGKTAHRWRVHHDRRAHPRSRGENRLAPRPPPTRLGSSPLTRGKRGGRRKGQHVRGLIPAHAGKTLPDLRFYRADRSDLGKP